MKILVMTSIARSISMIMRETFENAKKNNCSIIVIGDKKTGEILVPGGRFISTSEQEHLGLNLSTYLSWNSYSRKNLGYLEALKQGPEWILETDDDNLLSDNFFCLVNSSEIQVRELKSDRWVNIYKYFGNDIVWPRGFPLNRIHEQSRLDTKLRVISVDSIGVFQSIANNDPDVDAIFRLTRPLPQFFTHDDPLLLTGDSVCPFNSQATWWNSKYVSLMYFPCTVSWRAADIWRSYIATRILQANGVGIVFTGPLVAQERNEHDLLVDFKEEIDCYLDAENIWIALGTIPQSLLTSSINEALINAYECLIKAGYFSTKELDLVKIWIQDINQIKSRGNLI